MVDGIYAKQDVLLGMVEALVKKTERLAKGQSLKNMSYPAAFNDFCNVLASTSTRAYNTFKHQFGGRGIQNMRYVNITLGILVIDLFGHLQSSSSQITSL